MFPLSSLSSRPSRVIPTSKLACALSMATRILGTFKSSSPPTLPTAIFRLGQTVSTPNALAHLTQEDILRGLQRHQSGDWAELDAEDVRPTTKHSLQSCDCSPHILPPTAQSSELSPKLIVRSPRCCYQLGCSDLTRHRMSVSASYARHRRETLEFSVRPSFPRGRGKLRPGRGRSSFASEFGLMLRLGFPPTASPLGSSA